MEVTPPPMSIKVAPSCFSSSVSVERPLAYGLNSGQLEIGERRRLHAHRVHRNANPLAEHAAGVAHAARFIHHIRRRRQLDDFITLHLALAAPFAEQGMQMRIRNQRTIERCGGARVDADRRAAGDRDEHVLNAGIGEVFRCRHGFADRFLCFDDACYRSRFDAAGFAQSCPQHPQIAGLGAADQADRLGRADIQDRDQAGAERYGFSVRRAHSRCIAHQVLFPRVSCCCCPPRSTKK
jgi:hypothetical protein